MYTRSHGKPSLDSDINELVNELVHEGAFQHIPGRAYHAFTGFTHFTGVTNIPKFKKCVIHHQMMTAMERDIILNV